MPPLRDDVAPVASAIGRRLRRLRVDRRLTLAAVGDAIGVTPQSVHKYEAGQTQVPADLAVKLAGLFGVTTDAILIGEGRDAA